MLIPKSLVGFGILQSGLHSTWIQDIVVNVTCRINPTCDPISTRIFIRLIQETGSVSSYMLLHTVIVRVVAEASIDCISGGSCNSRYNLCYTMCPSFLLGLERIHIHGLGNAVSSVVDVLGNPESLPNKLLFALDPVPSENTSFGIQLDNAIVDLNGVK